MVSTSRKRMLKKAVKYAKVSLKRHGPMAAVVLQHRLREDYGIDLTSREIAFALRWYGKKQIEIRGVKNERGFHDWSCGDSKIYYVGKKYA